MIKGVAVALSLLANSAHAADFYFCWQGANGYTMTGQMSIRPAALNKPLITQDDVTLFRIAGYQDQQLLGKWDMDTRRDGASWFLNYDPARSVFLTPGEMGLGVSQAWNADGTAMDCGDPGFGFNLGNYAQDFCLNGRWVEESGMPPETPFLVSPVPVDPLCRVYAPTS
ncbi:hypothetical protein AN191_11875 [Loktanella sp. 5RATIMAR09]|uniref:hypothetical protein n=1 Tax=Loktanella sp. 5RATIMAR09 TaxID=1225655 RepID=UPI0006EBDB94|nr:hypothetical protein [Loktanella sp. 5RATIMAR09]KQI71676.1 hypothetical protein AN191_11875 [Loktanella sp. 5RATIMAR09]